MPEQLVKHADAPVPEFSQHCDQLGHKLRLLAQPQSVHIAYGTKRQSGASVPPQIDGWPLQLIPNPVVSTHAFPAPWASQRYPVGHSLDFAHETVSPASFT